MNIVIVGASGTLGKLINKKLKKNNRYKIYCISKKNSPFKYDLSKKNNIKKIIDKFKPNIVINCAGLINLKKCENDFPSAYKINSLIPYLFCNYFISNNLKIKFIHISTDHFFFDNKRVKRKEDDIVKLLNNYSLSKFIGESFASKYKYSLILRTNFISNEKSFIKDLLQKIYQKQIINLFYDYCCSTIHTDFLVEIISKIITKNKYGIYNLGSKNSLSKKDFFLYFIKYYSIKVNIKKIFFISINKSNDLRPKDISFNTNKFEKTFKINLPTIKQTIEKISI